MWRSFTADSLTGRSREKLPANPMKRTKHYRHILYWPCSCESMPKFSLWQILLHYEIYHKFLYVMAFFGCCSRRVFITSLTVFGLILLVSGTILTASHVFSKLIKDKVNEVSSIFIKIVFRIALKFSENVVFFCPVLDYITQFFFLFYGSKCCFRVPLSSIFETQRAVLK